MNNNERRKKATGTRGLGKIIIIIIIRFRQSWNVTVYLQCYIMYTHYFITTDWETAAGGMDKQPGQQGRCHLHRERTSIWGRADIAGSRLRVNYAMYIYIQVRIYIWVRVYYIHVYRCVYIYFIIIHGAVITCASTCSHAYNIIVLYTITGARVQTIFEERNKNNNIVITYLGSGTHRRRILENKNTWSCPASWCSGRTRRTACTCTRSRLQTFIIIRTLNNIIFYCYRGHG